VKRLSPSVLLAELEVGFGPFTERYISRVTMDRPRRVLAVVEAGKLLQTLTTDWQLLPGPEPNVCE